MKELCQKGVWIFVVVGCSSVLNITSMHKPKVYVVFLFLGPRLLLSFFSQLPSFTTAIEIIFFIQK